MRGIFSYIRKMTCYFIADAIKRASRTLTEFEKSKCMMHRNNANTLIYGLQAFLFIWRKAYYG